MFQDNLPIGAIVAFAGIRSEIPEGWKLCHGQSLNKDKYPDLFKVIKDTWGGKGENFNLPNLQGMFLRGVDDLGDIDRDQANRTDIKGNIIGAKIGSYQQDALFEHFHQIAIHRPDQGSEDSTVAGAFRGVNTGKVIQTSTDPNPDIKLGYKGSRMETRPKNAYVDYIIRIL